MDGPKLRLLLACMVGSVVFAKFGEPHGPAHWYDRVPGFWGLLAFFTALFLVGFVRPLLLRLLGRREDYYDD